MIWKFVSFVVLAVVCSGWSVVTSHRAISERSNVRPGDSFHSIAFMPNTANGEAVFKGHCTPCHGEDGKGKAAVGTPDFTSSKIQSSLTDQDILNTITNGRPGTLMPAWKGKLSTDEISAAAAYVRSLGRAAGGRDRF